MAAPSVMFLQLLNINFQQTGWKLSEKLAAASPFYSIPINKACDTSRVQFPINMCVGFL